MKESQKKTLKEKKKVNDMDKKISWKGHRGKKYGAVMHKKQNNNIRIVFGNINTLPKESNRFKIDTWKEIATSGCDINIIAEINKDISKIPKKDRTFQLVQGWWDTKIMCRDEFLQEKNTNNKEDTRQPGGVSIITNGIATQHIVQQGGDHRKLGRWRWVVLKGKQHTKTCVIGTYRSPEGWMTNLNQLAALRDSQTETDKLLEPSKVWFSDLEKLVRSKQNEGCNIVVAGDFNEDLKNKKSGVVKLMEKLNLHEAIMDKYKGDAPPTFHLGTQTIDGIYVSHNLKINQGGYIDEKYCPGDHHWLWIDIPINLALGENKEKLSKKILRKVNSKVPSIKNNFNRIINQQIGIHKLDTKILSLKKDCILEMKEKGTLSDKTCEQLHKVYMLIVLCSRWFKSAGRISF